MSHVEVVLENLKNKAKAKYKTIVLPESVDERVIKAAAFVLKEKIAKIILVGNEKSIMEHAKKLEVELPGVKIIDPKNYSEMDRAVNHLYERRKAKGMSLEEARKLLTEDPTYFGAALVGIFAADGMVSGCITETPRVIKSALFNIGTKKGISLVSSYFMMVSPNQNLGEKGVFFFADCGVNPNPNSEQLAEISKCTADSFKSILGKEPKLAMLSFSTKGSAKHPDVDKVVNALQIAKTKYPELKIDGELQLDAAVIPSVGMRKAPGSEIAGHANILIFPDLDSGNIGYKLAERFGNAMAFGPILQGLARPVNDLSRGSSAEDIVNVIEITALQTE